MAASHSQGCLTFQITIVTLKKLSDPNSDNHFHNNLRLFDALLNFLSPQMERSSIISNKQGVYEFPHEFPHLDLRKLGKIRKI